MQVVYNFKDSKVKDNPRFSDFDYLFEVSKNVVFELENRVLGDFLNFTDRCGRAVLDYLGVDKVEFKRLGPSLKV